MKYSETSDAYKRYYDCYQRLNYPELDDITTEQIEAIRVEQRQAWSEMSDLEKYDASQGTTVAD